MYTMAWSDRVFFARTWAIAALFWPAVLTTLFVCVFTVIQLFTLALGGIKAAKESASERGMAFLIIWSAIFTLSTLICSLASYPGARASLELRRYREQLGRIYDENHDEVAGD